jgi:hypothetical protein
VECDESDGSQVCFVCFVHVSVRSLSLSLSLKFPLPSRYDLAAATVRELVMFGGGHPTSTTQSSRVDIWNSTSRTVCSSLCYPLLLVLIPFFPSLFLSIKIVVNC